MLNRRILSAIALTIALGIPGWATTSFAAADEQDSAPSLQPVTASGSNVSTTSSGSDNSCLIIHTVVCTQTQVDPTSEDSVVGNLLLTVPTQTFDSTRITFGPSDKDVAQAPTSTATTGEPPVNKSLWGRLKSLFTLNEESSIVMGLDSVMWDIADHGLPTTIGLISIGLAWFVVVRRNRRKNVQQRPVTI